jgi:2-iminobutanoate/2-iminopropanoate deaminase
VAQSLKRESSDSGRRQILFLRNARIIEVGSIQLIWNIFGLAQTYLGGKPMSGHEKHVVATPNAPKAIGPYSQGIKAGCFIYCSGQLGLDPAAGTIVEGGVEAETRRSLMNLKAVLEAAGSGLEYIVKTTVFLRDMNDFARMNAVYGEFFPENPPARSTIQAAALPRNGAVEIEAIALNPD